MTSASTDRSIEEMLAMCRFYLEGVALLPVSIIGILGEFIMYWPDHLHFSHDENVRSSK